MSSIMHINEYVSVPEAAEIIGCTDGRVRQMLRQGMLRAKKISERAWLVLRKEAEKYAKTPQKRGRPRIAKNSGKTC